MRPGALNASFGLYCRDSERLLIQVESDSGHVGNEKFIYLVTIQETTNPYADRIVYIVSILSCQHLHAQSDVSDVEILIVSI